MTYLLHTATLSISTLLLFAHQTYAQPLQRYEFFGTSSKPMALESGQVSGLAVGYSHLLRSSPRRSSTENLAENRAVNRETGRGVALSFGALLGYGSVTENSLAWSITHQELRAALQLEGGWQLGRGSVGLNLSVGGGLIIERQSRLQASRLSQDSGGELDMVELSLSREGSVFVPEIAIEPTLRLMIIRGEWGTFGLSARVSFAYRSLSAAVPKGVSSESWSSLFGLYFTPHS